MLEITGPIDCPKGSQELLEELLARAGYNLARTDMKVLIMETTNGGPDWRGIAKVGVRRTDTDGVLIKIQPGDNRTARVVKILCPRGVEAENLKNQLEEGVEAVRLGVPLSTSRKAPADIAAELHERFGRAPASEDYFAAFELVANATVAVSLVQGLREYRQELRLTDLTGLLHGNHVEKFVNLLVGAGIAIKVKGVSGNGEQPVRINEDVYVQVHAELVKIHEVKKKQQQEPQGPAEVIELPQPPPPMEIVAGLQQQIAELEGQNQQDTDKIASVNAEIGTLQEMITDFTAQRERLAEAIVQREAQITTLRQQLEGQRRTAASKALAETAAQLGMSIEELLSLATAK